MSSYWCFQLYYQMDHSSLPCLPAVSHFNSENLGSYLLLFIYLIPVYMNSSIRIVNPFPLWETSLSVKVLCLCIVVIKCVKVAQSCPTLCDPMDYMVHGILQARILEWVAFPFSRGSSQPNDRTQVSCITGGFFTSWATREPPVIW